MKRKFNLRIQQSRGEPSVGEVPALPTCLPHLSISWRKRHGYAVLEKLAHANTKIKCSPQYPQPLTSPNAMSVFIPKKQHSQTEGH